MPGAGQTEPAVTPRLPDRIAIGVLTQTFPPELVDRVLATTGRAEQRRRLLPARVVLYDALARCLFAQVGDGEVMRLLVEGLAWARRWQVPDKSSIARTRARLGPAPLRALFMEVARPLATGKTKGAWYRGWRLLALDATTLDVPDTPANGAAFGRPGGGRGQGAFPQVRLVGLVECGTHAVVDGAMGGLPAQAPAGGDAGVDYRLDDLGRSGGHRLTYRPCWLTERARRALWLAALFLWMTRLLAARS
jgi:Insertion element 4 transposase N-terminal